jgi:hypothetical protein
MQNKLLALPAEVRRWRERETLDTKDQSYEKVEAGIELFSVKQGRLRKREGGCCEWPGR